MASVQVCSSRHWPMSSFAGLFTQEITAIADFAPACHSW
jgi:hypothetical protein